MNTIENQILANLIHNEEFVEVAYPYLKTEYFSEVHEQVVFDLIRDYIETYADLANQDVLVVELDKLSGVPKEVYDRTRLLLKQLKPSAVDLNWLVDSTEEWCKKRAMFNAIAEAAGLLKESNTEAYGSINHLIEHAQSVSFNKDIGHNLFENATNRWEYFNTPRVKISTGHPIFDEISEGGQDRGTVTLFLAPPNCGKSLVMCDFAANVIKLGYNALYITLELSEQKIGRRIESNLMDIDFHSIKQLDLKRYTSRIDALKRSTHGKLIIKQYPNNGASCRDFTNLAKELMRKKGFKPDFIAIDYLGITANSNNNKNTQTHESLAQITGQMRRLAMELDVAVVSAHQLNRGAQGKSDISSDMIQGSYAVMNDPDLVYGIINTDEHKKNGIIEFKQFKNRDGNSSIHNRFAMGVNASKMKLFDIDQETGNNMRKANASEDDDDFGLAVVNKRKDITNELNFGDDD